MLLWVEACDQEFYRGHINSLKFFLDQALQENVPDKAVLKKVCFCLFWFSPKKNLGSERKRLNLQILQSCRWLLQKSRESIHRFNFDKKTSKFSANVCKKDRAISLPLNGTDCDEKAFP